MRPRINRRSMTVGLMAIALGTMAVVPDTATATTLGEERVRLLLNTAVSYHYHANVRRKTAEGACFQDPGDPTTMRCSWRWASPSADAFRLRQKVKQDAVKWCKNAGGESCVEIYRNGTLSDDYDGLSPEQRQRLEGVLESIPSYDPEATALPADVAIEAGLYHERFAQMQDYWEDWRKKKKAKRHYAMCANEPGAGVRFTMQGGVKELPRVREMCILQCQAVAQWEGKAGRCYTIFENGKFTSAAAQRAMRLQVEPGNAEVRDGFVGAWKGIEDGQTTIETVIKHVDPDGSVTGTGCKQYRDGALAWRTLGGDATFVNGDRVTAMNGRIRTTLMMNAAQSETAQMIMTWPNGWQERVRMQSGGTLECHERFRILATAAPAVERPADDAPIVGAWSGRWKNGTFAEVAIEGVDDSGALTGRYCTKTTSGLLRLWDMGPEGRFEATLGKRGKKAVLTIPWRDGSGSRSEVEFRLKGADKITMKHRSNAGSSKQKVSTVKMMRGASEDGCLLRTTRGPAGAQG